MAETKGLSSQCPVLNVALGKWKRRKKGEAYANLPLNILPACNYFQFKALELDNLFRQYLDMDFSAMLFSSLTGHLLPLDEKIYSLSTK